MPLCLFKIFQCSNKILARTQTNRKVLRRVNIITTMIISLVICFLSSVTYRVKQNKRTWPSRKDFHPLSRPSGSKSEPVRRSLGFKIANEKTRCCASHYSRWAGVLCALFSILDRDAVISNIIDYIVGLSISQIELNARDVRLRT